MKKIFTLSAFFLLVQLSQAQVSMNMSLLGQWDDDSLPTHSFGTFNDIWGYVDNNNREYAIFGSASFIHFFDVTDPANLVEIDKVAGGAQTTWRDFKTYQDRIYAVSDNSGEGLIIFDASDLPNSVTKTYQSTEFFGSSHNIFIDVPNGRLYAVGTETESNGVIVFDIATDPDNPVLLGSVNLQTGLLGGYVHDLYVRDNIAYCSHGNTNSFVIWDFTDAATPEYIASFVSNGYNHSNWLTEDGKTIVFAEEVPTGLPLGILDVTNMATDELELYTYFKFPLLAPNFEGATPHNPFILGDLVYTSYYEDGLQVFDISDPANPTVAAYYDTAPDNTSYNGYTGAWGAYPYLPSGNIIVTDMDHGLHVISMDEEVSTDELPEDITAFNLFPNPVSTDLQVQLSGDLNTSVTLEIVSLTGQLLTSKVVALQTQGTVTLNTIDLASGAYFLRLTSNGQQVTRKFVKM